MLKIGAKGQGIAVDLLSAVLIFLLVVGSISWVWSNKAAESEKQLYEDEMQTMAENALDMLVGSSGSPSNWETRPLIDTNTIGLVRSSGVVSEEKLTTFVYLGNEDPRGIVELVGFWKFDEESGIDALDSSRSGNTGTLSGPPTWQTTDCPSGNCLSFDGAGDYVAIPNFSNNMPSEEITITTWVKRSAVADNVDLFSFDPTDAGGISGNRTTAHFPWGNDVHWQFACPPNCLTVAFDLGWIGNWKHFAFVSSSSESYMKIYRNGGQIATNNENHSFTQVAGTPWHIGGRALYSFNGDIDEVAIFDRALTEEEINSIYENGIGPGSYKKLKQKLLIGANDYYFKIVDPSLESRPIIENTEGEKLETGIPPTEEFPQVTIQRPIVYTYTRTGETEPELHEAIAELTLTMPYRIW